MFNFKDDNIVPGYRDDEIVLLNNIVDCLNEPALIHTGDFVVLSFNNFYAELFNIRGDYESYLGLHIDRIFDKKNLKEFYLHGVSVEEDKPLIVKNEIGFTRDGEPLSLTTRRSILKTYSGTYILCTFRNNALTDISRKHMYENMEKTFSKMASNLHDIVSKDLSQAVEYLEFFQRARGIHDDVISSALKLIRGTNLTIRRVMSLISPKTLKRFGLKKAIEELLIMGNGQNRECYMGLYELDIELDEIVEVNLFRAIQEAFNNAVKHSDATEIIIDVYYSGPHKEGLIVKIEDDGKGFNLEEAVKKRFGLISINERIELIGGAVSIETSEGKGTVVTFSIPLEALNPKRHYEKQGLFGSNSR